MAFNSSLKMTDGDASLVVGGIDVNNNFNDGSIYKLGLTADKHAYTFSRDRLQDVIAAVSSVDKKNFKTFEEYNAALLVAIKAVPGLLTPIPGCPEEWY